jgi:hypothetical protein
MKVLGEELGAKLKSELKAEREPKNRSAWNSSNTTEDALRFIPGHSISVQLKQCGHRARVEALSSGLVPGRAKCPRSGAEAPFWRHVGEARACREERAARGMAPAR